MTNNYIKVHIRTEVALAVQIDDSGISPSADLSLATRTAIRRAKERLGGMTSGTCDDEGSSVISWCFPFDDGDPGTLEAARLAAHERATELTRHYHVTPRLTVYRPVKGLSMAIIASGEVRHLKEAA